MVPRPGSTTPEDGVEIKQEPVAGAPSIGRSSVASELEEDRPVASWSSEGTFTTGHGASDDQEGYKEQFAVPDLAPPGATTDFDASRGPTGLKLERVEDQQPTPTRAQPAKRKPKRKKKMRAPESEDEPTPKTGSKDAGRQYTAEGLEYALSRMELFRQLERDPILSFIKPKLIGELTGSFHELDFSKHTSVRVTIQALFAVLHKSGFRVYDWDLESWTNAIYVILDPLTVLVGAVERKTTPIQVRKPRTRSALPPPKYASSEDSDSSVESPKRMPMRRPPRVIQLAVTLVGLENPSSEGTIPKTLEDAIVRLMQSTRMQVAPGMTSSAPHCTNTIPVPRHTTMDSAPHEPKDVAMESVSSRSSSRSKRGQDEDPDDLFDLDAGRTGTAAAVSTATTGAGVARVRLSAFSELKEFNGKDASEEKARAWFNRLKSASRRDGMTGDEVCALFGDLMADPARQWYLQLEKSTRKSRTKLTEQFRVPYCGKGVSMASRYYHSSKHVDETPLKYLFRLSVAGVRAKIRYSDGTPEEKREHVELFINTLGVHEQELASRLTLMEVPDTAMLEKMLRARQRGLAHEKKTLFGSNRFRQKGPTSTSTPARAVHAVQMTTDDYDSGPSDDDQICDQDRDNEERAKMFVTGHSSQPENARRDFETGGTAHDRPKCRRCGSRRHSEGDCWSLLTCQKCAGQYPTDHCLRACKAFGDVHDAGKFPLEEFFNLVWSAEARRDAPSHRREDVKLGRSLAWKPVRDERSMSVCVYVATRSRDEAHGNTE
ncbi:LOW QUALITY PROTEIN: Eukaryotic/viral aspartic protease [Phytophthora megakarya]|uniref:Eukaryotic/viral aspartic protease n=1 Tax=Phytophthora megakarya TaxID=4795 RepID=A0A225WSA4_9STRA|nr:LOW QUALITY PROTEIN: Eukaryotic/viral aspartic protease [Phytophthora megakarya]